MGLNNMSSRAIHLLLVVLFLVLVAGSSIAHSSVWIVDAHKGPGWDFDELQPAIDAAAPNDVIIVRYGTYKHIVIDGKGLTIMAAPNATSNFRVGEHHVVPPTIPHTIKNIPAGQSVVIRGAYFVAQYNPPAIGNTVFVNNNLGEIVFEDCWFNDGSPSLLLRNSPNVAIVRCAIFKHFSSWIVVQQRSGESHWFETECEGMYGESAQYAGTFYNASIEGKLAVELFDGAKVSIVRCDIRGGSGGAGGNMQQLGCDGGADGGDAIRLTSGNPFVRNVASTVIGGPAGTWPGCGTPGVPGEAFAIASGSVTSYAFDPGTLKFRDASLIAGGPVPMRIDISGPTGQTALGIVGFEPTSQWLPAGRGTLLVGGAFLNFLSLGTIGASGNSTVESPAVSLPSGFDAIRIHMQLVTCDPSGLCTLGSGSVCVLTSQA